VTVFAPSLLVARSVFRGWRQAPGRAVAAVVAGIAGVLLTTSMLFISTAVLDAIKGAPISGVKAGTVAVEALAPGGMSPGLAARIENRAAVAGSSVLVANARAMAGGALTYPVIVFGVDPNIAQFTGSGLGRQFRAHPLSGLDQVYLTRSWAASHGIRQGEQVSLLTPTGVRKLQVAALLDGTVANQGAVIIAPRPAVASAFLRGQNVDVLLLAPGARGAAAVSAEARAAAGGAAAVMAPASLFSDNSRTFQTPRTILLLFAVIAVLTAGVVLFVTWRLALEDARPMLARMRLVGVRTRSLALGSALAMLPLLLVTYVTGAALGVLLGIRMSSFTAQITILTQQAITPGIPWVRPAVEAFVAALVMFGAAWALGIRRFVKISAIDAVTGRDQVALRPGGWTWPLLTGLAVLALGLAALVLLPTRLRAGSLAPFLAAVALLAVALPVAAGALLRRGEPGPLRLSVSRQLQAGWRRNATLGITFGIAITMSLAMSGVAGSILADVSRSVDRWTQADLFVQAAEAGQNLQNEYFAASVQPKIAAVHGVGAIATFSYAQIGIDGRRVQVWNWGGPDQDRLVQIKTTQGPASAVRHLGPGQVAISSNFARIHALSVGDPVRLPLPGGTREVRVVAVVADASTDGGMIVAGPQLYRQLVGGNGIYEFYVGVRAGASPAVVRQQILAKIAAAYPRAVVLTQAQMRSRIGSIAARLVSAFVAFSWVMFVLAVLIGAATLASGLVERRRAFALWRIGGAPARMVNRQLIAESVVIAALAWIVALPVGYLAIPALLDALSAQSGLLPPVQIPALLSVLSLPLVVGCMLAALLLANPRRVNMPLRQLLEAE
jgi:putative ABC transport system permease protein